ncbi:MAG: ABC transporter ATP-binding protein, partial [Candidatus Brocadiae bacterium]|nr:ABC transporter ATP-binding protein [Candidatus Brocadiia bacterium]
MRDLLWKLEGICLAGTHLPRLAEVTCRIRKGVTAVMGCSGAGKTSLLNLLVAFETQDAGSLIGDLPGEGFSLPLFWVPQDAGLWPHLTAREHLEAVMSPGASPDRIPQMLDRFGILEKASARPDRLSMGERSRLAVARALVADAAVLVMDEPLAHVDWTRASEYWGVIRNHLAERGASLVFATHLPEAVMGEADRVICLEEGRLLYEGPVDELYWNPATRELAECLGAVNWLPQPEARLWLADGAGARSCYRPEQIRL